MKKTFIKRSIFIIMALACIILSSCSGKSGGGSDKDNAGDSFESNWEYDSARYYKSGMLISESEGDGFTIKPDDNGGISVKAENGTGYVPTTILSSKHKAPLDGLTVTIKPEKFNFADDEAERSPLISILWTTDKIKSFEDALGHYDYTATNGIRNTAQPTKGLCIVLNNSYDEYAGTMTASNLMITMIDGDFHDVIDHRLGYRWSFTARNFLSQSTFSDDTKIISRYEKIDISDGYTVSIRADKTHGYIVSVNGVDYYSAEDIAYYPNNVSDMYSEDSMTYIKNDIDLTPLVGAGDGYVNISVSGSIAKEGLEYDCTVSEINGVPAADWSGEH